MSLSEMYKLLKSDKTGYAGFVVLMLILIMAFVGPYFIKMDTTVKLDAIYQAPSLHYLLGTDNMGRDIFSLIVHGGKDVLIVAILAGFFSTLIAFFLGAFSGFAGGKMDTVLM